MSAKEPRPAPGAPPRPARAHRALSRLCGVLVAPVRSASVWLLWTSDSAPVLDRLVRRGGGLFAIATLSFLAGWLLPDLAILRARFGDAPGGCFRIAWVARITTGVPEEPGPILLIQTAWTRDVPESGAHHDDPCRASEVLLALPPLKDRIYATRDGVFVALVKPLDGPTPRLPVPAELCQRPTRRSSSEGTDMTPLNPQSGTQHRPA